MYITRMSLKANWLLVLGMLILFFVLRYTGTMIAAGATVPGGIFMPFPLRLGLGSNLPEQYQSESG